jgi:hypothetical protein
MPSDNEINAAFDAVQPGLQTLIKQFVPFMFEEQAFQALASHQGRQDTVNIIRTALLAAEQVRAEAKGR